MGQKVHPIGFRVGVNRKWRSNWFNSKKGAQYVKEDHQIRALVHQRYRGAGLADITIERPSETNVSLTIRTARPGIIIGKGGTEIDAFQRHLEGRFGHTFRISIQEVDNPDIEAVLIAEDVAYRISNRFPPIRAIKEAIRRAMEKGAQGIKVSCAGRLGGAEIARTIWQKAGRVPLHTLRADVDYGFTEAWTKTGHIGVKVWLFRGEHVKLRPLATDRAAKAVKATTTQAEGAVEPAGVAESPTPAAPNEGGSDAAVDAQEG